jgi:hypothetical protein
MGDAGWRVVRNFGVNFAVARSGATANQLLLCDHL